MIECCRSRYSAETSQIHPRQVSRTRPPLLALSARLGCLSSPQVVIGQQPAEHRTVARRTSSGAAQRIALRLSGRSGRIAVTDRRIDDPEEVPQSGRCVAISADACDPWR